MTNSIRRKKEAGAKHCSVRDKFAEDGQVWGYTRGRFKVSKGREGLVVGTETGQDMVKDCPGSLFILMQCFATHHRDLSQAVQEPMTWKEAAVNFYWATKKD